MRRLASGLRSGLRSGLNPSDDDGPTLTTWTLEKTGGVNGTYDAGASTDQTFLDTVSIQWTVPVVLDAFCVGLSADNPNNNYTGIDFGILNDAGTIYRSENGSLVNIGTVAVNDVLKVTRAVGTGAVTYHKNGALISTSGLTTLAALLGDSSFRFSSDRATVVTIDNGSGAVPLTWTTSGVTATGAP